MRFGDIRYPLAMARFFSPPDMEILQDSSDTVHLCDPILGHEGLHVLHISAIHSVVSMFPELQASEEGRIMHTGKFALMQHPHTGMARFKFSDEAVDSENDSLHPTE